jgi:Fur family iron response transcriptional regulator
MKSFAALLSRHEDIALCPIARSCRKPPCMLKLNSIEASKGRRPLNDVSSDVVELLQSAGLRPTHQRKALAHLLFSRGERHLTAEMLYEEALSGDVPISLATVYNTLNQFTKAGLLRQVSVDGTKSYFDSNVSTHQHFYVENTHELIDIPENSVACYDLSGVPTGYEVSRVDLIVRLRRVGSLQAPAESQALQRSRT